MPFIKTQILIEEYKPLEYDPNAGLTLGQIVDQTLADTIGALEGNSVPQSIEVGFEGPQDFHNFMRVYDPFKGDRNPFGRGKKSKRPLVTETVDY